ncbi:MAG: rsbV1 [Frankiales bacterium]|nr:rsbV1 [Frankiales bacterium]
MTLTASVLHDDGLVLLALAGELDAAVTDRVQETVDGVLADGLVQVVVDLTGLEFCDSTGLGSLMRTHRLLTEAGGRCVVAGARGPVLRLLRLMSMERVLVLADDVGEALETVRQDATGA